MIKDMKRHGFTVLELIIVISVMAILIVLGTVSMRGSIANMKDIERESDIDSISIHLESFFTSGTNGSESTGYYPSTVTLIGTGDGSISTTRAILRNIDPQSLVAPGDGSGFSLVKATNADQSTAGVTPQPTTLQYIYQPIQNDGASLCDTDGMQCRKFNLYYRLETDGAIYKVTSKNQ